MAISKIKTGSITDSAVNTNKLAPGSVGSTDISTDLVTGLTELSETAADTDYTIIYDTSSGSLKKILRSNLKQQGPTISSISPTNANDSQSTATFTITGTGFTAGSNARFIDTNGKIIEFDTVTRNSTTQITATIAASSLSIANDPYDIQVTNGEGIASVLTSQVNFNAVPTYVTASGSLGEIQTNNAGSFSVNATDPDSAGSVTFELQSGSLPPGYSLTNTAANGGTAVISGTDTTTSSDTVYNFTLRAVDAASNTTSRAFSITSTVPVTESFTSSGTFSVPSGVTAVDVLVVAGGGGGGGPGPNPGGGGAGGLIFFPGYPVTPGGTVSVTVGNGGSSAPGAPGQDSVFGTLTAKGGGGGGNHSGGPGGGLTGGSGGGASGTPGNPGGAAATQPTQPGDSGTYGFGNAGGSRNSCTGAGGGGGGGAGSAGAPGQFISGQPCWGGGGGAGKSYTIADGTTPVYYAGGGAGNGTNGSNNNPLATSGGGGLGSMASGQGGQANKGGGAGGSNDGSPPGGKGVVIVRY